MEENNIDKVFRTAASAYSAPTPSGAWDRMQSALAAKRRRKAIFWWLFSAGILVIISVVTTIWVIDNSFIKSIAVEKQEIGDIPIAIEEPKTTNNTQYSILNSQSTTNNEHPDNSRGNNQQQTTNNTQESILNSQSTTNIPITIGTTNNTQDSILNSQSTNNNKHPDDYRGNKQQTRNKQQKTNNNEQQTTKNKFFITFDMGWCRTGAFSSPPETLLKTTVSSSESNALSSFANGFNAGIYVTPKWMIFSSFHSYDMKTSGDLIFPTHNLKYIEIENFGYTAAGYYDADFIEPTMSSKGLGNIDYLQNFSSVTTSFQVKTFSLGLGQYSKWKKWTFDYRASLSLANISNAEIYYQGTPGKALFGKLKGLKNNTFGFSIGGDALYTFDNHVVIGLKTEMNIFASSINTSKEFSYYPWSFFIGPHLGLKF